jgi:hypothetical protein
MYQITKEQYDSIHTDYRSIWQNEQHPDLIGKRTAFENSIQSAAGLPITGRPCTLIFEGIHFEIKGK